MASSLVLSLGTALKEIASTFEWLYRLVVTGGSLTRRPQRSLRCLLMAETTWQINEKNCKTANYDLTMQSRESCRITML